VYGQYNLLYTQNLRPWFTNQNSISSYNQQTTAGTKLQKAIQCAQIYSSPGQAEKCLDVKLDEFIPITLNSNNKFYFINGRKLTSVYQPVPINSPPDLTNLETYIKKTSNALKPLLKYRIIHYEQEIYKFTSTDVTICSDGGAKAGKGSFGISLVSNNKVVLECFNIIQSSYEEANSHRSEAVGVLVTLKIIELIHQYMQEIKEVTHPHQMIILCDNGSVVKTINKIQGQRYSLKQQYAANMDVLRAICISIHWLRKRWRCAIKLCHIHGHQDKHYKALSIEQKTNVHADALATSGLKKIISIIFHYQVKEQAYL
jgi:hypothetical protein